MLPWLARELAFNDSTLVGFWPFFKNTHDYSGYGEEVASRNDASLWQADLSSRQGRKCYESGSYIGEVPACSWLDFNTRINTNSLSDEKCFTITGWFYLHHLDTAGKVIEEEHLPETFPNIHPLFSQTAPLLDYPYLVGGYTGWTIANEGDVINCEFVSNNIYNKYIKQFNVGYKYNQWHHLAVTVYRPNEKTWDIQLYMDGFELKNGLVTNNLISNDIGLPNLPFRIGGAAVAVQDVDASPPVRNGYAFTEGNFYLVRAYNRILGAKEIGDLYQRENDLVLSQKFSPNMTSTSSMTLAVTGHTTTQIYSGKSFIPLNIIGIGATQTLTLYTSGSPANTNLTGNMPLYTVGGNTLTSMIPLFVRSQNPTGKLKFFVEGGAIPSATDTLQLSITGSTNPGFYNVTPLYTTGSKASIAKGLNLYIATVDEGSMLRSMNLYVGGKYADMEKAMTLFMHALATHSCLPVWNEIDEEWEDEEGYWTCGNLLLEGEMPLFMAGAGVGSTGEGLKLYIERNPNGIIPMVIFGPGAAATGSIPLVTKGHIVAASGIPLAIPDAIGAKRIGTKLYTHGF